MRHYKPSRILVEKEVLELGRTTRILEQFPDVPHEVVENYDSRTDSAIPQTGDYITKAKKTLYLKRFKGSPIKLCPGFSDQLVCCNYHIMDFVENCPFECVYCILQAVLNRPVITLHVNTGEIIEKVTGVIKSRPEQNFRVGTGEFSDSFALEHILGVNTDLVETFAELPNALLELKTKSSNVDSLIGLNHQGRTVVSWSMSTKYAGKHIEYMTAPPMERIAAAARLVKAGYYTAFHFDPLIVHDGWEEGYREIIGELFDQVPVDKIGWISMGSLRYMPKLKEIAESRFPNSDIFANEFVNCEDGKTRYFRPIRQDLHKVVYEIIREYNSDIPVYICMDNNQTWQKILKDTPRDNNAMESLIVKKFNIGKCGSIQA